MSFSPMRKWSYIDKNGRIITTIKFDSANPFENGLGGVTLKSIFGYVNRNGEIIWMNSYAKESPKAK